MFLLLFTYVLVFNFYPYHFNEVTSTLEMLEAPNIYEWILLFWILSYFCDEIFLVLQVFRIFSCVLMKRHGPAQHAKLNTSTHCRVTGLVD